MADKIILQHLRKDCSCFNDNWYSCIYGDEGELDQYDDSEFVIDKDFLSLNYCGVSPKLSRRFCDNCELNLRKISQYIDNLDELANNWNSPFDPDIPNPYEIKSILRYEEWQETHKDINNSYSIKKFDDYFNKDLKPYIEELKQYDVINLGWYFDGDLSPLAELPNLKGIILGHWFGQSLDCLAQCVTLEYVHVRYSYNRHIIPEVYDKVFRN